MKRIRVPFREYLQRQIRAIQHPLHKQRARRILGHEPDRKELSQLWVDICSKYFGRKYTYK